ncbi:CCG5-like protein [Mya arenaria]|uniref:CCG5-like protein n=1 Tax=Mya arenaria TaxID=6604 RepID=A0ABY7DK90_MYAAR|nr:CCG5-like protein [Mya arenaria]
MFPVVSLVMITVAVILGLTLAVGIIFYISAINDEVGHRAKGKEGKTFIYQYGWSFYFAGIAFMIAEATAVVFVTQFMQRHSSKDDMVRIIPGLGDKLDSEKDDPDGTTNPTIVL